MKGLPSLLALAAFGLASAPVAAQNAQPADKPAEPAKIRRAETIVDDNWTVTCALTDQTGAKKQCSAVLRIAQTDKSGAQRIVFSWLLGRQDGKLESVFSVPSGVLIQPGVRGPSACVGFARGGEGVCAV